MRTSRPPTAQTSEQSDGVKPDIRARTGSVHRKIHDRTPERTPINIAMAQQFCLGMRSPFPHGSQQTNQSRGQQRQRSRLRNSDNAGITRGADGKLWQTDTRFQQIQVEPVDNAVMVGVAHLPCRARARVRLKDAQIEVVHHAVEIEVAGICGHHRHRGSSRCRSSPRSIRCSPRSNP